MNATVFFVYVVVAVTLLIVGSVGLHVRMREGAVRTQDYVGVFMLAVAWPLLLLALGTLGVMAFADWVLSEPTDE